MHQDLRRVGQTTLELPRLGLGCAPIGGARPMSDADAQRVLEAAWRCGIRYFDTAPWYGNTQSEHRLGTFLRTRVPGSFFVSTKVGRVYRRPLASEDFETSLWRKRWPGGLAFVPQFDYSADAIMLAYEQSLARLGLPRVDALAIHDLDMQHQGSEEGIEAAFSALEGGGFDALMALKSSGEIKAIGAGINVPHFIPRFLQRFPIDYFVVAMPYTLLDQSALAEELPLCAEKGASVIIGAPFASGILATGSRGGGLYGYKPASADVLDRVARIERVAEAYGVSLPAAALQFPLGHPQVTTIIPGADAAQHVEANVESMASSIPAAFWHQLVVDGLIDPASPLPSD